MLVSVAREGISFFAGPHVANHERTSDHFARNQRCAISSARRRRERRGRGGRRGRGRGTARGRAGAAGRNSAPVHAVCIAGVLLAGCVRAHVPPDRRGRHEQAETADLQQMSAGDLVFFWLGGPENVRGIYGWGTLLSKPEFTDDRDAYRVRVRYDRRLGTHLPVAKIRLVDQLKNLLILRAPQATNFILSGEEAQAIADLMEPSERPTF